MPDKMFDRISEKTSEKIVYFSGVHGSGKSTLARELAKQPHFVEHRRIHHVELQDTYIRTIWRLTKYYIEAREQEVLSRENPSRIILGQRCVYDNLAYADTFLKMGWISSRDEEHHRAVFDALFPAPLRPRYVVHLAPGADWVKRRLEERWVRKEQKWHESDFNYLEQVVKSYDSLYMHSSPCAPLPREALPARILRVEETDLAQRVSIITRWMATEFPGIF